MDTDLTKAVDAHGERLFRLAFRILGDAHAAEDAVQEAFARACARGAQIHNRDRIDAWLSKVVVNESLRVLRHGKMRRRVLPGCAQAAQDPDPLHDQSELRDLVIAALVELPETTRVVVVLRVMEQMSGNEVAALLGSSAASVSRHLYRGMEQLREGLAVTSAIEREA